MNLRAVKIPLLIGVEYLKRSWKWALGIFLFLLLIIIAQVRFNFFSSPNVVRIALVGTYQEHDLPKEVTAFLSKGLVVAGDDGRINPNLVSGWDVNNNATEFKFKLKEGLKWADNSPIVSTDLEFNIPDTTVSYPDDKTIQFKLKESYSPLPSLLIKPVFKKGTLIGMGPYNITKIEKSRIFITKISLKSNNPDLPLIYIRFYPSEKVATTGYNLGEVQVLYGLSDTKLVQESPLTALKEKTDYTKIVTVLYQTGDELLGNRSLRQALSYQIPQIPNMDVADNPYPPRSWAYNSGSKKYLSNNKEAKEALERAKTQLPEEKLTSEIILTVTPSLSSVGDSIIVAWKKLGFDAKLRVESGIPQNFQALLITQSIPIDPDQYFLWHATQTKTNLTKYDSKRADKDLEDGRKAISEEDRKVKYYDFQKTLLEDAPAAFLYFPKYKIIYLKKIEPLLNKILSI